MPGEDGSVKEIMSYEEWDNITTEDINKGIVIVDHAITYDNGQPSGIVPDFNEYVWVPIPDFKDFARIAWITACTWDGNGNWINGTNTTISSSTKEKTKTMNIEDVQTNSSSWGNYRDSTGNAEENSGIKQNTGTSEYWKANNIYDLVGNVWEWTQEKYSTGSYRAERAGSCYTDGDSYPAACRSYYEEEYSNDRSCFRASFFITVDSNNNE